jgi:nitrate reductase delta subunit
MQTPVQQNPAADQEQKIFPMESSCAACRDCGEATILQDAYTVIAELWCSPHDVDINDIRRDAEEIIEGLMSADEEAAMMLARFIGAETISEADYIDLFELQPKCSLYLGGHSFDEPKTCAGAGVSDRNAYMIEVAAIYRHFGKAISGNELPDYLPLMIDFLSLTTGSRNDAVREKFIREYILPFLPPMRKRLEEINTPYLHLLDVLERIISLDLNTLPVLVANEKQTV